jgi:hypothetical protein
VDGVSTMECKKKSGVCPRLKAITSTHTPTRKYLRTRTHFGYLFGTIQPRTPEPGYTRVIEDLPDMYYPTEDLTYCSISGDPPYSSFTLFASFCREPATEDVLGCRCVLGWNVKQQVRVLVLRYLRTHTDTRIKMP